MLYYLLMVCTGHNLKGNSSVIQSVALLFEVTKTKYCLYEKEEANLIQRSKITAPRQMKITVWGPKVN